MEIHQTFHETYSPGAELSYELLKSWTIPFDSFQKEKHSPVPKVHLAEEDTMALTSTNSNGQPTSHIFTADKGAGKKVDQQTRQRVKRHRE